MRASVNGSAQPFTTILFASDLSAASQATFHVALCVCAAFRASLSILHVFEYPKASASEPRGRIPESGSHKEGALESLERFREEANQAGVRCETIIASGITSLAILKVLSQNKNDLVVLGTSAPHGFERLVFGSTAETVLREATCPVLTVGPHTTNPAMANWTEAPVVFATNFHRTTTHAIRYAATFCKTTRSPLHCLHVLPQALESGSPSQIVPQIMKEALCHIAAENNVETTSDIYTIAYGSDVSKAITEYARQHRARLIVLGIEQSSILASHISTDIAYRIITESLCPVLTIAFASESPPILAAACL
jgi:nucleotide-binding universal stress UspA family protein